MNFCLAHDSRGGILSFPPLRKTDTFPYSRALSFRLSAIHTRTHGQTHTADMLTCQLNMPHGTKKPKRVMKEKVKQKPRCLEETVKS